MCLRMKVTGAKTGRTEGQFAHLVLFVYQVKWIFSTYALKQNESCSENSCKHSSCWLPWRSSWKLYEKRFPLSSNNTRFDFFIQFSLQFSLRFFTAVSTRNFRLSFHSNFMRTLQWRYIQIDCLQPNSLPTDFLTNSAYIESNRV